MSVTILGVDPGLRNTGLCLLDLGTREARHTQTIRDAGDHMADLINAAIRELNPNVLAIEDFVFRSPRVSGGVVKHASHMGRLLGRLDVLVADLNPIWVKPSQSKARQPEGALAKKLGVPGRNDHERSAYYAALFVAGTVRMAGGR